MPQPLAGGGLKRWLLPVNLLLLLFLARDLADQTWRWLWHPPPPVRTAAPTATPAKATPLNGTQSPLSGLGLFGRAERQAAPVQTPSPALNAPDTRLNLTLMGIFFSGSGSSLALIASPGAGEKPYRIGDRLPGGARVTAIHADRVLLDVNGRAETLRLPRKATPNGGGGLRAGAEQNSPVVRELWDRFRENPETILENLRMEPAYLNGRFEGVTLLSGADPGFLSRFGLKSGDVVTWVNGVELTDPLEGMKVLGTLGGIEALHFRVRRGSETHTFDFFRQ